MDNGHFSMNKRSCSCQDRFQKKSRRKNKCSNHCDCRDFFQVDFSGLTDNLNFKLLKGKDCKLEMNTIDGRRRKGKTDHVGIDFVDIKNDHDDIVTVLKDKIVWIDWLSQDCRSDYDMKKRRDRKHDNKKHHDHEDCHCRKHDMKDCHDDCRCRRHDEKDCHDDFEWWKHHKKDHHEDCHCRKHDMKDCHDDCRCRRHDEKDCHDDFEWWKHHKKDRHEDCRCRKQY